MNWNALRLEDKPHVDEALLKHPTNLSDYTFSNLWMWHGVRQYEISKIENHLCLRFRENDKLIFLYPIGDASCRNLIEKLALAYTPMKMRAIPESALEYLEGLPYHIDPEPDRFDYIYDFEELLHLHGNFLQPKRNLVHQFMDAYNFTYLEITAKLLPQVIEMEVKWFEEHQAPPISMKKEHEACLRALNDFSVLNLSGSVLIVDGRIIAYTIAEYMNQDMLLVHIEKALYSYKGAYQMMNQQLLIHSKPVKWINREEDLGFPNLAKGKLSYHPEHMEKKFAFLA